MHFSLAFVPIAAHTSYSRPFFTVSRALPSGNVSVIACRWCCLLATVLPYCVIGVTYFFGLGLHPIPVHLHQALIKPRAPALHLYWPLMTEVERSRTPGQCQANACCFQPTADHEGRQEGHGQNRARTFGCLQEQGDYPGHRPGQLGRGQHGQRSHAGSPYLKFTTRHHCPAAVRFHLFRRCSNLDHVLIWTMPTSPRHFDAQRVGHPDAGRLRVHRVRLQIDICAKMRGCGHRRIADAVRVLAWSCVPVGA